MKLKKLLRRTPIKKIYGPKDIEITGLTSNSKLVCPGHLFIAKRGRVEDGAKYIPEAIRSGAKAVLTNFYDPSLNVTQIIYPDIALIEPLLAAEFYDHPSREMLIIGVTGTSGKTTTTFLIKHLLDTLGKQSGLIGTIEYINGQRRYPATRTTPDVISNHKMLREMKHHGCEAAVMEVTSHALDQNRVELIDFDVAVFTNLTLEHLDYHKTVEAYAAAKQKFFLSLNSKNKKSPKVACFNADSPWSAYMSEGCKAKILTFGCVENADFKAENIALTPSGTHFDLIYLGEKRKAFTPMAGRFNVYNALGAIAALASQGHPLDKILDALKTFPGVPGRLELVANPLNLKVFVDFAHKEDALINVLDCLKEFKVGKIITVFGCGGDRDRTKRPKMARAIEENSDIVILTNDNPRTEDPALIAKEAAAGFQQNKALIELDRKKAIGKAIELATLDDIVLIAGKGHEPYQIFAHKTIEFDDRKVALELATLKAGR